MRNEETGCNEHEETDDEGGYIEQQDDGLVELHGCCVDIVAGGVEAHEAGVLLQQSDADADDVSPY